MDLVASGAVLQPRLISGRKCPSLGIGSSRTGTWSRPSVEISHFSSRISMNCKPFKAGTPGGIGVGSLWSFGRRVRLKASSDSDLLPDLDSRFFKVAARGGLVFVAIVCGVFIISRRAALLVEALRVFQWSKLAVGGRSAELLQVLCGLREQWLVLATLLGFSAFFSMTETSIATLWPWMVHELAEEEYGDGIFTMLQNDITRFLTTILFGTTIVNVAVTVLVTEAALICGEAGVAAAIGVVSVAVLLLTEIIPRSLAAKAPIEIARAVVRPIAWFSWIVYPLGRVIIFLSMGVLRILGLTGGSEPYVTKEEMKLIVGGAELRSIEEEEQDMIENVLEIKDTDVKEVMTPLVDVIAIDASADLIDFYELLVTHQYSRVPVFEQRVDNIVGIAYATDMLEYVDKVDQLRSSTVGDIARKPAYFVIESMSVSILLREFRIRKVHMAVVLNEYGGSEGIVTVEDVVEEVVGEIFDENDSKERIQRQTGYVVRRTAGVYDVGANTSIDRLSEELNIRLPEDHEYETVSGFICDAFGYIPKPGEIIKVVLENTNLEENGEYSESQSDQEETLNKHQLFKIEVLAGNARRVSAVRFERIEDANEQMEIKDVAHLVPKQSDQISSDFGKLNSDKISLEDGYSDLYMKLKDVDDHDNIIKY
ncbi:hypothetical protein H6P81_014819 [Aristolochia fimbriata]|uniref:Uncharacterized protein n=1 Tax=Aristolochia fimbriata TaxID=158543 RepID=A0AAV7E3T0_ARIFI|nr:hypothetical protein H6P81_014819 [Aristolochia fimbriata]